MRSSTLAAERAVALRSSAAQGSLHFVFVGAARQRHLSFRLLRRSRGDQFRNQLEPSGIHCVVISSEDRVFFKALGARIAQYRKEQGITQVQFAEILGVSQQIVNAYEMAERRAGLEESYNGIWWMS